MLYEPISAVLKDGSAVTLRPPEAGDAAAFLSYLRATSAETDFMVRYPDEITTTGQEEAELLEKWRTDPYRADLAAFGAAGELMGNCSVARISERYKMAHRAELGMSIYQKYWHLGLGTLLLRQAIAAARAMPGVEQVQLSALAGNSRAIALYERLGFVTVGRVPRGFRLRGGGWDDEIWMVLAL